MISCCLQCRGDNLYQEGFSNDWKAPIIGCYDCGFRTCVCDNTLNHLKEIGVIK